MSPWERVLLDALTIANSDGQLRPESMLRSYQRYLAEQIELMPVVLGAAEMSLGKTAATLTGVKRLLRTNRSWRALIVAPLEVAKNTWPDEVREWEHLRGLTYTVVIGTEKQRLAALAVDVDLTIINRENLQWLWKTVEGRKGWRWEILVFDESSRLKGFTPRTKGTENSPPQISEFGVLLQARSKIKRVVELTGTPAPNGIYDLGGQARVLFGQSSPLGQTKHEFEKKFFDKNKYTFEITPKPGAEEQIMNHMKPAMIGLRSQDYIDLPPQHFNPIYCKLTPPLMKQYKEFEKTLYAEDYDVEAVNNGVLSNKLLQMCIAKDTLVLTDRGWVSIQNVDNKDKIWDGVEWVSCDGNISKGFRHTVSCYGVNMTLEHRVLTVAGWKTAKEILNGDASARLDRQEVRLPNCSLEAWNNQHQDKKSNLDVSMCLRQSGCEDQPELTVGGKTPPQRDAKLRLYARRNSSRCKRWPWYDRGTPLAHLDADEKSVSESKRQGFQELWWARHRHVGLLVQRLFGFLGRCAQGVCGRLDHRPSRQFKGILQGKLSMGVPQGPDSKYEGQRQSEHALGGNDAGGSCGPIGNKVCDLVAAAQTEGLWGESFVRARQSVEVYDLVNCGLRSRFVVMGHQGPLIVHNCSGGLYRMDESKDPPVREVITIHDLKIKRLQSVVAEAAGQNVLVAYRYKFEKEQIRAAFPKATFFDQEPNFVKRWNAGEINLGVAHPASIGHGLNLQYGGHIQVWMGPTWSLELWDQFNRRLARPGQKAPTVFIHVIITRGTEDERQYADLRMKGVTQDRITERVRLRKLPSTQITLN